MTEPTDSEILDAADDFRSQYMHGGITFDEFDSIGFARAVLAKWGTPPAVTVEPYAYAVYFPDQPTEELVHDLDELCDDLTNREHTITKLYATPQPTQAQATPQSGAKSFQTYAEANAYSRGYYAGKKAAAQAQAVQEWDPVPAKACIKPTYEAADAFWEYWKANGETHKHGYYESTWGAINKALACGWTQPVQAQAGAAPRYRLLVRGRDTIQADDEFLREDGATWLKDPSGIFVGCMYEGTIFLPARRAIDEAHGIKGGQHDI